MDEGIVAADANPLITLASAGVLGLLPKLFGRVLVTATVRDEVLAGRTRPGVRELNAAIEEGWAVVVETAPTTTTVRRRGAGEPASSRSPGTTPGPPCC